VTAIVVAHLVISILHGLAHRELHVVLAPPASIFVIVVTLIFPLIAMGLLWAGKERLGLLLLSLALFASLIFGLYHHFMAAGPDNVWRRPIAWGTTFHLTAYLLCVTEAIGTYVGIHFLGIWNSKRGRDLRWALLASIVVLALATWQCCFLPQARLGRPSFQDCDNVYLLPGLFAAATLDLRWGAYGFSLIWYFALCYTLLKSWRLLVHAAVNRGDARWAWLAGVVLSAVGWVIALVRPNWDLLLAPGVYAANIVPMFFYPLDLLMSFPGANQVRGYVLVIGFSVLLYSALSYAAIKAWRRLCRVAAH